MKKKYIIPIFVPHFGCPNDCVFCNQRKISGQSTNVTAADVEDTIRYYLSFLKNDSKSIEVAFYGGSFTAIEGKKQEELLSVAYKYVLNKQIGGIRISTRPDYINKEILRRLKNFGVSTIELGVQSANDEILNISKRGHSFEDVKNASRLIRKNGFVLGHQMMVGLPESTRKDEINTAKKLIKLKPKIIRIYPVLVIKGTELCRLYEQGKYEPIGVEAAVQVCKDLVKMFESKKINVIRVGLQNTNEISDPSATGSDVVDGPFHPAFRQLVQSAIWYDKLAEKIKKLNSKIEFVSVKVNPEDVNDAIGHKKCNVKKMKEFYNVKVEVIVDKNIKKGKFKLIY